MTDTQPGLGSDAVSQTVSLLAANGFPRMPAAVLMAIMTSEDAELTAEALASLLQASPAAISGALGYLGNVGMVSRHRIPGSRPFVYTLPPYPWYTASFLKTDLYDVIATLADRAVSRLGPVGAERMAEMGAFFRFLERRMPQLLDEWNTELADRKGAIRPN